MSRALALHEVTFRELWEATTALEVASAEQAALHATPAVMAELDANVAATEAAVGDPAAIAALDTAFHALIAKAAKNRVLELAREPSSLLIFPTTELVLRSVPEGTERLVHAHRMIVDAVRRGDREATRRWMLRHINDWRKGFERAGQDLDEPVDRVTMLRAAP
jgi:DNA-binding FadR family transcriptional regulator